MTHWLVTEAKTQEVQCYDSMEALGERLPDLCGEENVLTDWFTQELVPKKHPTFFSCALIGY